MKQLEKKDLIIGEVYKHQNGNFIKYQFDGDINGKIKGSYIGNNADKFYRQPDNNFTISCLKLATPEEKHWLEVCIAANSFISYDEAMKKFIPEYVEAISNRHSNSEIIGTIYKTSELPKWVKGHKLEQYWKDYMFHYKPSTKEAYDAQFVVKEPEFVLPEKWGILITEENRDVVLNYRQKIFEKLNIPKYLRVGIVHLSFSHDGTYYHYNSKFVEKHTGCQLITFEQFKKYVLKEQLEESKDKVLEKEGIDLNIEKIIRVESSEGAIYQLGDKITVFTKESPNKGKVFTIKGFRWNNAKTNICVITELHSKNGIGLDKIELYSEPVVKELSLLEQAKLKYPIGTKFKVVHLPNLILTVKNHEDYYFQTDEIVNLNVEENINGCTGGSVYRKGQWAEIIDDFKLPETWWITIENEKQLEIAKQYFSQYFTIGFKTIKIVNNIGFVNPANWTSNTHMFNLTEKTKRNNPQITFEQFEQYVLHNGFKVGDRFNKIKSLLNHTAPYAINEKEIIDLQYINNESVAFYKHVSNNYSGPQCRILTKNIVK